MKKWMIGGIGTVAIAASAAYIGVGNYFYNFALRVNNDKQFLEGNEAFTSVTNIDPQLEAAQVALDEKFVSEHLAETISIISTDDLKLQLNGTMFTQKVPSHKWVITTHGYTGQSEEMLRWARNFYARGFNVLMPNLRGHGNSEGAYIGMGWHDRYDMLAWIDEIIRRDPNAEIVLLGISMGAATVMNTSGEEMPSNVKVVIEDSGFSSVRGVFGHQLKELFRLPEFPVLNAANTVTKWRAGYDLFKANPVEQIAKSVTPTLFIHGDQDSFVPFYMLDEVYQAANLEKEKLVIEGAGHTMSVRVDPVRYWETVFHFIEKYID